MPPASYQRPEATTYAVEDLVPHAKRGGLRLPAFQRLFKWKRENVRDLFDSIYRGFPIGTLLFWKKPADAARFHLGSIAIDAPAQSDALWIIDGQQRISSLVSVLSPGAEPGPGFDLYFDLAWEDEADNGGNPTPLRFRDPRRQAPLTWLPMRVVLDSEDLDEWLDQSGLRAEHLEYVRRARKLNKLLREYKIPVFIVEGGDLDTVGLLFERMNTAGAQLTRGEVFNAFFAGAGEEHSLSALSRRVIALGFGELDQDLLLRIVLVVSGADVTTTAGKRLAEEIRDVPRAIDDAEGALEATIRLLKHDAGIPHKALLPYSFPLLVLGRFFKLFPSPSPRSRALLARWVWRGAITEEHRAEQIPAVREIFKGLDRAPDEEEAVQSLLQSTAKSAPAYGIEEVFRFGTARSKLELLALAALGPRDVIEGTPIEVGPLLASKKSKALSSISPSKTDKTIAPLLVHPPVNSRALSTALTSASPDILMSHGFSDTAADALARRDIERAIVERGLWLERHIGRYLNARARWGETDRPSLARLARPIVEVATDEPGDDE